jgi:hypothetical protein
LDTAIGGFSFCAGFCFRRIFKDKAVIVNAPTGSDKKVKSVNTLVHNDRL